MPDERPKKAPAKPPETRSAPSLQDLLANLTLARNLAVHAPSAETMARVLRESDQAVGHWAELMKTLDYGKLARLQAQAMEAGEFASKAHIQAQALRSINWDASRLPSELRVDAAAPVTATPPSPLEGEIAKLRREIEKQSAELLAGKADAASKERQIDELQTSVNALRQRERLVSLLNQVHPAAQSLLEGDEEFRKRFLESKECTGFVMSVDIRRSTDLMLKARSPDLFASFLSSLSAALMEIVFKSFGVFDKFTGDGILAFFPEFYSGRDAGYHALKAAMLCHEAFARHYREFRHAFVSVLQDTGLGIGIDFGTLHLVQVAGPLTVVGPPVVYACRLGGAAPGTTLINQPAFEVLSERCGVSLSFDESSHEIKHEGRMLAYTVRETRKTYEPSVPDWFKSQVSPPDHK